MIPKLQDDMLALPSTVENEQKPDGVRALKRRRGRPRVILSCVGCHWVMSIHRFANHVCTRPKTPRRAATPGPRKKDNSQ
jgi:hypothetical protein